MVGVLLLCPFQQMASTVILGIDIGRPVGRQGERMQDYMRGFYGPSLEISYITCICIPMSNSVLAPELMQRGQKMLQFCAKNEKEVRLSEQPNNLVNTYIACTNPGSYLIPHWGPCFPGDPGHLVFCHKGLLGRESSNSRESTYRKPRVRLSMQKQA